MHRRQVLAATTALLPLAGCLSGTPGDGTTTDAPDETTTTASPSLGDATLAQTGSQCATQDATEASVAFESDAVAVTGTIVGADACFVATLAAAEFDPGASVLTVTVRSERQTDEDTACAQCITAIDYEVRATFADGLPERVVVEHERDGGTETVAEASRG
ncbi:MAG: hypothetical protein ABEJ59_04465 [Halanaeroarchaeum sp.]